MMKFPRGLIVSCQAYEGDPMFGANIMANMAKAAEAGGAVAIRVNSPQDIRAIRRITELPIIGLYKVYSSASDIYITPDFESAESIALAGSDIIAVDSTNRARPKNIKLSDLFKFIIDSLHKPIMADISCVEEAVIAESLGADMVSTTLSGYTSLEYPASNEPDLALVEELVKTVQIPVVAEGRYHEPLQVARAMILGAYAVVVGEAITRPEKITERYVHALNSLQNDEK